MLIDSNGQDGVERFYKFPQSTQRIREDVKGADGRSLKSLNLTGVTTTAAPKKNLYSEPDCLEGRLDCGCTMVWWQQATVPLPLRPPLPSLPPSKRSAQKLATLIQCRISFLNSLILISISYTIHPTRLGKGNKSCLMQKPKQGSSV